MWEGNVRRGYRDSFCDPLPGCGAGQGESGDGGRGEKIELAL